jgi:tRNA(Ile)-lysidine synthase
MLRAVQQTLEQRKLLQKGAHVLIAVSGGADSVALTYVLHYLRSKRGLSLTLAHLNHRIRGTEADEDAHFVREMAWRLGLPCVLGEIDVPRRARSSGLSMEMAAREARYDFLARVAREVQAGCLATAHTADDQVETVLLKLARGAGPQGLSGIPYESEVSGMRVVRPMRDVTHEEAVRFLRRHRLKWREDSSNTDLQYLRNRVRHEILPMLEANLNPRIRETILRTADVMAEENAWLNAHAMKVLRMCRLKSGNDKLGAHALSRHAPALRRRVVRLWLADQGVDPEQLDFEMVQRVDGLAGQRGGTKRVPLPGNKQVMRQYDVLSVRSGLSGRAVRAFHRRVAVPGETVLPDSGLKVITMMGRGVIRQTGMRAGDLPAEGSLDRAAIGDAPLIVRTWKKGDRIKPFGFQGSKKLQDVFVDEKIPRDRRSSIPVFECRGQVVWIPGYRVASGWEVKDASGPALHVLVYPL